MRNTAIIIGATALAFALGQTAALAASSKPRTQASIECSNEANAKNLHGKERKKFRAACKKNLGMSSGKSYGAADGKSYGTTGGKSSGKSWFGKSYGYR